MLVTLCLLASPYLAATDFASYSRCLKGQSYRLTFFAFVRLELRTWKCRDFLRWPYLLVHSLQIISSTNLKCSCTSLAFVRRLLTWKIACAKSPLILVSTWWLVLSQGTRACADNFGPPLTTDELMTSAFYMQNDQSVSLFNLTLTKQC